MGLKGKKTISGLKNIKVETLTNDEQNNIKGGSGTGQDYVIVNIQP